MTTPTLPDDEESPNSPSRDRSSEMDYDDENKENIDPMSGQEKENQPTSYKDILPLAPRIVLRDARSSYIDTHCKEVDEDIDKIRRSTEQLNISNPEDVVRNFIIPL